jgi:hypothetical protein
MASGVKEAIMRRSSLRTVPGRFAPLFLSLPLALLTFASTAVAGTVPVPSAGPLTVPLTAPGGAFVSLSGALVAAAVVAFFALVFVLASRRQRSFTVTTGRAAPRMVSADRSGDRLQGDLAVLLASGRAGEKKRKLAA